MGAFERDNCDGEVAVSAAADIDTMVARIVARFHPRRVVLFGSRARGTEVADSDVDLLVVLDRVADKRRTAVEIRRVLSDLTTCKDILVTTPEEIARRRDVAGSILGPALREGRVVYEQS